MLLVIFVLLLSLGLAEREPVISVVLGLMLDMTAVLYVLNGAVRRRIDGALGIGEHGTIHKIVAVLIAVWAGMVLVGYSMVNVMRGEVVVPVVTATTSAPSRVVGSREAPAPVQAETCAPGLVRWGLAVDPDTGAERLYCGVAYTVVANNDDSMPGNVQIGRRIAVAESTTREQLAELLEYVYATSRATAMADPRELKEVHVFVFTSERRAKAGGDEWVAKFNATGTGQLPPRAVVDFKLPPAGVAKPSALEEEIYDAFWVELEVAGTDEANDRIEREMARRFKKSVKEIRRIYTHVNAYRNGGG